VVIEPRGATVASAEQFTALMEQTFDDVWRFVRRRVESNADADDVTSEVYSVAWRRWGVLPEAGERRLWLFGVARNVTRNHQRAMFRQRRVTARLLELAPTDGIAPVERDDDLWEALSRLGEGDRDVLLMRAWDQLTIAEMASLLQCTSNAVSVRLSKARTRLRIELDGKETASTGDEPADSEHRRT